MKTIALFLLTVSLIANASVQTLSGEIDSSEFLIEFEASDVRNMEQTPRILFTKSQIPQMRQWINTADIKPVWDQVLELAKNYCDPDSSEYVSADWVANMPGRWLAMHGRHLSDRLEIIGLAYHFTGEEKFGLHGAKLLTEAAESLPTTHSGIARGQALGGARGDMLRVFATGLDMFDCALTQQQREKIHKTSIEYLEGMYEEEGGTVEELYTKGGGIKRIEQTIFADESARVHNFSAVIWGAAGPLAFHFLDTHPIMAENIITLSNAIVIKYIYDAYPDGAAMEGVSYVGYAFSNIFLLADTLRTAGLNNLYKHPTLPKLIHFHAMTLLPGEDVFDPRSSADYNSGSTLSMLKFSRELIGNEFDEQTRTYAKIARFFADFSENVRNPAMRLLYENQTAPLNPADAGLGLDIHYQRRGLVVFRTGWEKDDLMFSIETGEHHPGSHGYADNGHITLYGLGRRWMRDPGTRNHPTHFFNCVLINGLGQGLSGRGYGTSSKITDYYANDTYGYLKADLTQAYAQGGRVGREVPGLDLEHVLRHSFFVQKTNNTPAYTVVLDDIKKNDSKNDFSWLLHSSSEMRSRRFDNGVIVEPVDAYDGSYLVNRPDGSAGMAGWRFNLDTTGEYTIWARVKAHRESHSAARVGSFTVQIDNEDSFDWLLPTTWQQEWIWAPVRSSGFELPSLPPDLGDDLHRNVVHGDDETLRKIGRNWHNFKSLRRYFAQRDSLAQPFELSRGAHLLRFNPRRRDNEIAYLDTVVISKDINAKPPFDLESDEFIVLRSGDARVSRPFNKVQKDTEPESKMLAAVFADEDIVFDEDTFLFRPRLSFNTHAVNPRFAVVLIPFKSGQQLPQISYDNSGDKSTLEIRWQDRTDKIEWDKDITKTAAFTSN